MKELRKSKKRSLRNEQVLEHLKILLKTSRREIESGSSKAVELVKETTKAFDKAAQRGIIKKNLAARKKSRLMKKLLKGKQ